MVTDSMVILIPGATAEPGGVVSSSVGGTTMFPGHPANVNDAIARSVIQAMRVSSSRLVFIVWVPSTAASSSATGITYVGESGPAQRHAPHISQPPKFKLALARTEVYLVRSCRDRTEITFVVLPGKPALTTTVARCLLAGSLLFRLG